MIVHVRRPIDQHIKSIRAKVDPSVTVIPEGLFSGNLQLQEVELCEGLLEIREGAFFGCLNF